MAPNPAFIYHITNIENLVSIIKNEGLIAYSQIKQNGLNYVNIAHQTIHLLAGRPILISSPLGPIVKPQGREQSRVHYDMLAANEYCKRQGKTLKELTTDEMQQFQVEVKALKPTHRF